MPTSTRRSVLLASSLVFALVAGASGCSLGMNEAGGVGGGGGGGVAGNDGPNATGSTGSGAGAPDTDRAGTPGTSDTTGSAGGSFASPADLSSCGVSELPATSVSLAVPHARRMSAPEQARAVMLGQHTPPAPGLVRTREFLSYYDIDYGTDVKDGLAVSASLTPGVLPTQYVLTIGVEAAPAATPRRPMAITVVVDTSFSMGGPGIERARYAVAALANSLAAGDTFNIVTTNPDVAPVQLSAAVAADPAIVETADSLVPDGGDDLPGALASASKLANESLRDGGLNRIVLITDGAALPTTIDLATISADATDHDIQLVGVGVGNEMSYRSDLLTVVTDAGRGPLLFIGDQTEANRMLHDRFDQILDVAARDVQVAITVPGMFKVENLSGEGYAVDPTTLTVSDLGPGRSMTFRQILRACSADVVSANPSATVAINVRWKALDGSQATPLDIAPSLDALTNAPPGPAAKAAAIVAVAEALQSLDASRLQAAKDLVDLGAKAGDGDFVDLKAQLDAVTFTPTP